MPPLWRWRTTRRLRTLSPPPTCGKLRAVPTGRRTLLAGLAALAALTGLAALAALACAAPAPAATAPRRELVVAAAMSLKEAMHAIEADYEARHPEIDLVLDLAGSNALAAQILAGARVDLFIAADEAQMARVVDGGLAEPPATLAHGRLVVIAHPTASVHAVADLTRPGLRLVLAGAAVPAGAYARQALDALGLHAALRNLVSDEDNVRGVLAKVVAGEADAGIAYATDARSAAPGALRVVDLPPEAAAIRPRYELAVLRGGDHPKDARDLAAALLGPELQAHLRARGFEAP